MLKNKIALLVISFFSLACLAQQPAEKTLADFENNKYIISDTIGFNYIAWNETLNLQSAAQTDRDKANFTGFELSYDKKFMYPTWGWSLGAEIGSGKATGGGNSTLLPYQKGNQAWTSYGIHIVLVKKISSRFAFGMQAPIIIKQIDWANDQSNLKVNSGKNIAVALLFQSIFRITSNIGFFQAIGFFNTTEGATLWKAGLSYGL